MKPSELVLRCYAEKKGGVWQAFCIDLTLAAQGDSLQDVQQKLKEQIYSYVYDALQGQDKEYGAELLSRRAPLIDVLRFETRAWLARQSRKRVARKQFYPDVLPLALA